MVKQSEAMTINTENAQQYARIGDVLIAHAKLKNGDIERILERQTKKNILFGEAARELGLITIDDVNKVLAQQFGYAYINDDKHQVSDDLIAAKAPFTEQVEKLRSLRGQLLLNWFDLGHKTLAITSVSAEDGASRLAANLAIVFSQLNKNTLLIDANLRNPNQQKLFAINKKTGLSNLLANQETKYELTTAKSLPNLSILTSGTAAPNPQELIVRDSFINLLSDLEAIYDIIIIDTAPESYGLDFLHVARQAKACLMVARKNKTYLADIATHHEKLKSIHVNVIGSVIQEI